MFWEQTEFAPIFNILSIKYMHILSQCGHILKSVNNVNSIIKRETLSRKLLFNINPECRDRYDLKSSPTFVICNE